MIDVVIDRTEADVAQRTAKGHYNVSDLNRVEKSVQELAGRLNVTGHNIVIASKTNWAITDIPTLADMERYRTNIATIRSALAMLGTTPPTPGSIRNLTWQGANDIEIILQDVEWLLDRMPFAFRHSGTFCSGQEGLIL